MTDTPARPSGDMVEAVAIVICCARARCEGCNGDGAGGCFDLALWDAEARAAIAAMQPHLAQAKAEGVRIGLERAAAEWADDDQEWTGPEVANAIRALDPDTIIKEASNG